MDTRKNCSIEGCERPTVGRGWCGAHYQRWWAHGNPLSGGPLATPRGEPQRYFREVVLAYEGDDCLSWPYNTGSSGYGQLSVDGRNKRVSRLVCEHVHGPPPTPEHEAAHSCGKGNLACCTKRHLSWKTSTENSDDQLVHGTRARGESLPQSKLTEADVLKIRSMKGKSTHREITAIYDIKQSTVSDIWTGRSWSWL